MGPTLADQGAKTTENDPQDGAQIDPKTIKNRCQNRHKKRCQNQEGRAPSDPRSLGWDPPPGSSREAPQGPRGGGPGTTGPPSQAPRHPCACLENWPADIGPGTPPREPPGGAPGTQGRQKVAIYSQKKRSTIPRNGQNKRQSIFKYVL